MLNKNTIRQIILQQRKALLQNDVNALSLRVCDQLQSLSIIADAKRVALYYSHANEVSTLEFITWCVQRHTEVLLPVLSQQSLLFYPYTKNNVQLNKFSIPEPRTTSSEPMALNDCDAVIVPLVAFDQQGCRIGRGGGFYDRALVPVKRSSGRPVLIGLAYDFQYVESCHPESHDVSLDIVVTPRQVYRCKTKK